MSLLESKELEAAATLLLSFEGLLRTSEVLKLSWSDILFCGDQSLHGYGPNVAGVTILDSTTARASERHQFVKADNRNAIQFLKVYKITSKYNRMFARNLNIPSMKR